MKYINSTSQKGAIVLSILVYASIAVVVVSSLVGLLVTTFKSSTDLVDREQSFQIAEAGIDYYRWHLAHSQSDYYDGQGATSTGPYVHIYYNKDGEAIGKFTLTITPPIVGSTLVKVKSKGTLDINPHVSRSILVNLASSENSLRQSAYRLLCSLSRSLGLEGLEGLRSCAGLYVPESHLTLIASVSERFAAASPTQSLAFIRAFTDSAGRASGSLPRM